MPLQFTRSRLMSLPETDTFVMAVSILRSESRVPSAQSLHNSHAVQSLMSCTLGALLLAAAGVQSTKWRSVAVTVALTALLALALIAPLPSDRFVMATAPASFRTEATSMIWWRTEPGSCAFPRTSRTAC